MSNDTTGNSVPANRGKRSSISLKRSVINFILFAAGFCACNYLLEKAYPSPLPELIQSKLDHFREHKDEYDVVFIGSSMIQRHIIPSEFDRRMKKQGHEVRSFNFGIPAMRFHEADLVIDRLLSVNSKQLKWLVIEVRASKEAFDKRNWFSERYIHWHTPSVTLSVIADTLGQDQSFAVKAEFVLGHMEHMLIRSFHVGAGRSVVREVPLFHRLFPKEERQRIGKQGFISLDRRLRAGGGRIRRRRARFLKHQESFQQRVEVAREKTKEKPWLKESDKRRRLDQAIRVRKAGIDPIFFVGPVLEARGIARLAAENDLITLFAYNDPERYPNLYDLDHRFDRYHVNSKGARILTRLVARDFAAFVED